MLQSAFGADRMRAEGFATWFETYAAGYSSVINRGRLKDEIYNRARFAVKQSPNTFTFSGDAFDYARASMYFAAIVDRRGLSGLMEVYKTIINEHADFFGAIRKTLGWDRAQLEKEVAKVLDKH